jgi:transposase-like protein
VAAKKKRKARKGYAVSSAETRAVAVARVDKLAGAGTPVQKAIKSVAKELGVSIYSVQNWRTAANKAATKKGPPVAAVPERLASKAPAPASNGKAPALMLTASLEGLTAYLEDVVPRMVKAALQKGIG